MSDVAAAGVITTLPLAVLVLSPTNPRKIMDSKALDELAASLGTHGMLNPLLVRPLPPTLSRRHDEQTYEVVSGRRRYEAAKRAKWTEVPVQVRVLSDDAVREVQIIENLQREDVHPLEEADGFAELIRQSGAPAADVAKRVGKPAAYVERRLRLRGLVGETRKAWVAGQFTLAHAEILCRLPRGVQLDAVKEATSEARRNRDEVWSVSSLRRWVASDVMLDLTDAPWALADAELVVAAGACTTCPKRTGTTPGLFADLDRAPNRCTDPTCFAGKMASHIAIALLETPTLVKITTLYHGASKVKGALVGEKWQEAAAKSCPHTQRALVVEDVHYGKQRTGRILTVCATPTCKVHHGRARGGGGETASERGRRLAKQRKTRGEEQTRRRLLVEIAARTTSVTDADLRLIAGGAYGRLWYDHRKVLAQIRGLTQGKRDDDRDERAIERLVAGMKPAELAGFLKQIVLVPGVKVATWGTDKDGARIEAEARRLKVNIKKIRAEVAAQPAPKKKAR